MTGLYTYYSLPASPYPESVNKHLRRALYHEGAGADLRSAARCYLDALEEATSIGLDQTGDLMSGLKIKIGAVYERAGRSDAALRIYAGLLHELQSALRSTGPDEAERLRLLRRALGVAVKVGDIATADDLEQKAELAYVWALETMLQESRRRGVEGDDGWLEREASGGIYEAAAQHYYHTDRPHLALPLYLKAVERSANEDGPTCHTVTLMNNVASSMYSQKPDDDRIRRNAMQWAERARDLKVTARDNDDMAECRAGRAAAVVNLAEMTK